MSTVLDIRNLSKTYGSTGFGAPSIEALKAFSCVLHSGEILGVLGPSGAGKTTLMKIILHAIQPTEGSLTVLGESVAASPLKTAVGCVPESFTMPLKRTVHDVLIREGRRKGIARPLLHDRITEVAEQTDIIGYLHRRVEVLPHGVMGRIAVASALLTRPALLLLDDTTEHLDVNGRRHLTILLDVLRAQGRAILMTSHACTEVEAEADRIILLHRGLVVAQGSMPEVFPLDAPFTVAVGEDPHLSPGWTFHCVGGSWCSLVDGRAQLDLLLHALSVRGIPPRAILPSEYALEAAFDMCNETIAPQFPS